MFLLLFLVSSLGITINAHICQGKIKSIAFFQDAEQCGMSSKGVSCENTTHSNGINKTPCCKSLNGLGLNHYVTTHKTLVEATFDDLKSHGFCRTEFQTINSSCDINPQQDLFYQPPERNSVKPIILFEVFLI